MKKLSENEIIEIKRSLPNIKKQLTGEDQTYKNLSVFNKWLNRDECEQIFTSDKYLIEQRRKNLENTIYDIFHSTNVYLWRFKRHNRISFYKPKNIKHLLNICQIQNQTQQHGERYEILLPEFSAIYSEGWDWTNTIWYTDIEKIKPLLEIIKNTGLYILPEE